MQDNHSETAVFIGFGISGVAEFCSYVKAAIANQQKPRMIIFEKNPAQFATGEPFRTDTTTLWLLNGPAAEGFKIPENEVSMYEWIMQNHQDCHDTYGDFEDRYPPRAVIGEYLLSRYQKYKKLALMHGMEIEVRFEAVNHLDVTPQKHFLLQSDSAVIEADFVGLGLGTLYPDHFQEYKGKPGFIHYAWNSRELDKIPADEKEIIVVGGHLTFVDTIKYLMLARQYQGNFFVATRHPNMIATRDFKASVDKEPMLALKKQYEDHQTDKLSFEQAFTLFNHAYEASAKHPVDEHIDTHYALTTQVAAQTNQRTPVKIHGDIDELCAFVNLFADSGTYAALWGSLDAAGQEEFAKHYFGRLLAYLAGVPLVNARLLKEWYDSGRVTEKSGMTGLRYDDTAQEYVCSFNDGSERRAKYVVNAAGMGHHVERHIDEHPLLAHLLQKGTISITDFGGIVVNEHHHVISSENKIVSNLIAVGPGVYKGLPSGEASYFIADKAERAVQEHFRMAR